MSFLPLHGLFASFNNDIISVMQWMNQLRGPFSSFCLQIGQTALWLFFRSEFLKKTKKKEKFCFRFRARTFCSGSDVLMRLGFVPTLFLHDQETSQFFFFSVFRSHICFSAVFSTDMTEIAFPFCHDTASHLLQVFLQVLSYRQIVASFTPL